MGYPASPVQVVASSERVGAIVQKGAKHYLVAYASSDVDAGELVGITYIGGGPATEAAAIGEVPAYIGVVAEAAESGDPVLVQIAGPASCTVVGGETGVTVGTFLTLGTGGLESDGASRTASSVAVAAEAVGAGETETADVYLIGMPVTA